jgi:arylsulfatase
MSLTVSSIVASRARGSATALSIASVALAPISVAAANPAPPAPERPNIIVILADDMGYSDIGAFGGEIRTPVLDRLARDGRQFTQAYNSARCCPTRASLLTGLYPHQTGVGGMLYGSPHPGYQEHLALDCVTLAEALREAGYRTYMTGKWHLAPRSYDQQQDIEYWPTRRGFDRFYGSIAGYGSFWDPSTLYRDETPITPENDPDYQPETYYYTDAKTDVAIDFLRDHQRQNPDQPFFLYLSYTAAHWPLHVPDTAIRAYDGVYDAGYAAIHRARVDRLRELDLIPEVGAIAPPVGDWAAIPDKPLEAALMAAYAAMVTVMDDGIGRVVEHLRATGQLDNTIIFYLQDNGSNAEDWFGQETVYAEPFQPMGRDELQTASLAPMQTRDGRPVRTGHDVWPGPADTYTALKENWANVSNAPFRKYKHYSHEGGISTPLIVHWPDRVAAAPDQAGRLLRDPVHLIDIMPTCLDAAGVRAPTMRQGVPVPQPEGVSLLPLLTGAGPLARSAPIFFEHESSRAVRAGDWKLVAVEGEPWELYDMATDRGEMHDLASAYPGIVARLAAAWYGWAERAQVMPFGGWYDRANETTLSLRQGEVRPAASSPLIAGRPVNIQARVLSGPAAGVILAQGTAQDGFSLFIADATLSLVVQRAGETHRLDLPGVPPPPFKVVALFNARGRAMVGIDDRRYYAQFPGGPRTTPDTGISAGLAAGDLTEAAAPAGLPFAGKLGFIQVRCRMPGD